MCSTIPGRNRWSFVKLILFQIHLAFHHLLNKVVNLPPGVTIIATPSRPSTTKTTTSTSSQAPAKPGRHWCSIAPTKRPSRYGTGKTWSAETSTKASRSTSHRSQPPRSSSISKWHLLSPPFYLFFATIAFHREIPYHILFPCHVPFPSQMVEEAYAGYSRWNMPDRIKATCPPESQKGHSIHAHRYRI